MTRICVDDMLWIIFKVSSFPSTTMKLIRVGKLNIADLEANGLVPAGLQWSKPLLPGYCINLIKNDAETRTIIMCTDVFGSCIGYAIFAGNIDLSRTERVLDLDEIAFIRRRYPELSKEIESISA